MMETGGGAVAGLMSIQSMPFSSIARATYAGGRLAVPVPPSLAIYASFKHVVGVPSESGSGASLDKVKLLDTLIDRLAEAERAAAISPREFRPAASAIEPARMDALIERYRKELVSAIRTAELRPYAAAPRAPTGIAFALSA
jgi:hypothetical protein